MKAPRLKRSKTNDAVLAAPIKPNDSRDSAGLTFKTSFDDIRSPDGRQKLREQLTSQFPESYASSLKSSPSAQDMAGRDWLNVGQNGAAKSSSSSVDTMGNMPKRLSAVPEKNNVPIDVESAIHLLTELKKTATPEQLVALHKALLPTRDSTISNADSVGAQRSSLIRQKSMLPAGLATRGGASEDLLKRQEDVEPVIQKRKSGTSEGQHRLQSKSSIAALDLADEAANPLPAQRAATPNDQHYFGAYRPGTLRITNGAASPEPSLRPKTSGEESTIAVPNEAVAPSRQSAASLAKTIQDGSTTQDPALDSPRRRADTVTGDTRPMPSQPRSRDPSLSRQYRPVRSQEPGQSTTPLTRSREPSLSRQPLQIETKQAKPNLAGSRKTSVDTLLRRSIDSITIRKSFDDGHVSPIDAPRFAQRWSHRASQISQEYMNDCDVPVSPFDDKQSALAFAQRLSTVYDREDAENTANETPEAALGKLEGSSKESEPQSERQSNERQPQERSEERRSLKATAEGLNSATRPPLVSSQTEPRPRPNKADSGYVSDASHQSMQRQHSHDASMKVTESPVTYEQSQPAYKEMIHRVEPDDDDIQSLYTLEQILKMPSLLSGPSTPSRPDANRKHSSLLKLTGLKKSSLPASRTTLDPHSSADSLPLPTELAGSSPVAELKPAKSVKKLQKRMPEEVRKQRKALREKEKSSLTLAGQSVDDMGMPTDHSELMSNPANISELATASAVTLPMSPLADRTESNPAEVSELVGDSQMRAELDADESATAPRRSLSRRQSKKSRRRSRQKSITAADAEEKTEQKRKRSFSLGRKRSKSKRRSGSLTPKGKSQDASCPPSIAALSASWDGNGSQKSPPRYSDYGSVARTLGTNPYDISSGMFKKSSSHGPVLDELQSPHQTSTAFSRTKTGGLQGMDSAMASELARMKSRDVAKQNNEELYDRPRMATPNKRSQQDMAQSRSTMPNALMVEQRSPGWHAQPIFRKPSFETLDSASRPRPHSIAESIPSLPELPVDAEARSDKAAEYLARRDHAMHPWPILAESPSFAATPDIGSRGADQPGFSSESVAEAIAKAKEGRRAKQADRVKSAPGQKSDRVRPRGPRMNSNASSSSGPSQVSLQIHGVGERPYSDASASIVIGVGSDRDEQESRPSTASAPKSTAPEPSIWERQAQLWRQRRESTGKSLGKPVPDEDAVETEQAVTSPAIVVSTQQTPSSPERDSLSSAQRRRRKSASEHATAYRDLIGSEAEPFAEPLPHRASAQSTVTTTSTTTMTRSSTDAVIEQALPAKAYQAPIPIHRARSPGGRVRTPSGSYHPYNPDYAAQVERSRAGSLAQLEGRGSQSLDMLRPPPRTPGHQASDTLESILGRYDRSLSPVPGSEAGDAPDSPQRGGGVVGSPERMQRATRDGRPMVDRYGGGLQYGYERGVGLQGSSGLRASVGAAGMEKGGNRFSERFGLDLGDVPMFLRRAG